MSGGVCDSQTFAMNARLLPGVSLHRVAEIVRNAVRFGAEASNGDASAAQTSNSGRSAGVLPGDHEVVELFTLLRQRRIPYLLVGGIALLRYVQGRNTEDLDLLMSLASLQDLPEIAIEDRNDSFARGRFHNLRVDLLLTTNALFAEAQREFGTTHTFAELEVPTATPEGLVLLKLYALPSLYRQGQFDRVAVYESDVASLVHGQRVAVEPLLERLRPHVLASDLRELHNIVRDIQARIARFEQFNKRP